MLLAVDIGNTSVTLGLFNGEELKATWHLTTDISRMSDEYAAFLITILHHKNVNLSDIKDIAICSVVPPVTRSFEDLSPRFFNIKPFVIEAGVKTGVRIRMDNPKEVGADRIADAAAAHHLYGGPVIIADLGTATTFDTVSKEGDFIGGAIAPGMSIAAEALHSRTAKLPRIELVPPKVAIGKNTVAAMQSGIMFGFIGLLEGIISRIQAELGEKGTVVATGGYADMIARETKLIDVVNPNLILTGIKLIYDMNRSTTSKESK